MKNLKKFSVGLTVACLLTMTATTSFASNSFNSVENNSSYAQIQMSRGSSNRSITPAPATNITSDEFTGRIDISRGSSNRQVTPTSATNITADEPTGRLDMSRGSSNYQVTPVPATNIAD